MVTSETRVLLLIDQILAAYSRVVQDFAALKLSAGW
jgi:hypothetical protein